MDRLNAHLSLSLPLVSAGSEWNARWHRKLMAQTLRLAAKTASEHPSEHFVALVRLRFSGPSTIANLVKMGVRPDQIVS